METKVIKVEGMTCTHCQATVEEGLKGLAGVSSASANFQSGEARVAFDPEQIQEEAIREKVRALGYQA